MGKKKTKRKGRPKILPQILDSVGVIHAGLQALPEFQAGDMEGGGKTFIGQLSANYGGYNVVTNTWDPAALAIGYGIPVARRVISRMGIRIKWPF